MEIYRKSRNPALLTRCAWISHAIYRPALMKSIVKTVHLPSVVQSELYEVARILFVRKENKNNDLWHLRHTSAILENIRWTQTVYAVLCQPHHTDTLFLLNNDFLNKVIIFIFFAYKRYSRRFIKFRLNHWWQMDCFNDVLTLRFCALTV